uniref:Uncharacterized protein n=1 Tax=Lepeophtheirus salmonis TaxID=72036 RepID=A0A0K2TYI4_LEPSM
MSSFSLALGMMHI